MSMAESELMTALETYLAAQPLAPAPVTLGVVEPAESADLPAVVLSIEESQRLDSGLGRRSELRIGALAWQARIDLANPTLPGEPGFSLISGDRRTLILPHGGLVKQSGAHGPLTGADLQITVAGAAQVVTSNAPAAGEVQPTAAIGQLLFGTPLPAAGEVQASYYVGQWEQQYVSIRGTLRVDVEATTGEDTRDLSGALLEALGRLLPGKPVTGLQRLDPTSLGSIGARDAAVANARRRTLRFRFEFEQRIDRPDASGGIIHSIPITSQLDASPVPIAIENQVVT
jgi:hypothetical protein